MGVAEMSGGSSITVTESLNKLKTAGSINKIIDIVNELSASASGSKGAVLYSGPVGGVKSDSIATKIATSNGLDIIDNTDRGQFLSNSAVKQRLTEIYREMLPDATNQHIQELVKGKLFGGSTESLWGKASAEFVQSIKGKVIIITQDPNMAGIFSAVEASEIAANEGVTAINNVAVGSADRSASGIISLAKASFANAVSKGGIFGTAASEVTGRAAGIATETLASLGLSTAGAKSAAKYLATGFDNIAAPVLRTAVAAGAETTLAAAGSKALGLLGTTLRVAGSATFTFITTLLWSSPLNTGEDEALLEETEESLAEDTPATPGGTVTSYSNGFTAVNEQFGNALGTQHDQYVFTENPSSGTALLGATRANDSFLVLSSSVDEKNVIDQRISDTTANGKYADQIAMSVTSMGGIKVAISIEAAGRAEVLKDVQLSEVDDQFTFKGASGTLTIDHPVDFTGTISDFVTGDMIDLASIGTVMSAALATNNLLTMQAPSGDTSLQFVLSQNYAGSSFVFDADGNGGTNVAVDSDTDNIVIPSGNALLLVNDPSELAGTITGFVADDVIDLAGIGAATSASLGANNVLTVHESGGAGVAINLSPGQNFSDDLFETRSDGNGGTDISIDAVKISDLSISFGAANAINDGGQIVGALRANRAVTWGQPFLWQNGTTTDLSTPSGQIEEASGINNAGEIVGVASVDTLNGAYHAVLWRNGSMTDLGTLTDSRSNPFSQAYAINDSGQIVGSSFTSDGAYYVATMWSDGAIIDLGSLVQGDNSTADAINSSGQAVGFSFTDADSSASAVEWQNGTITNLGSPKVEGISYSFNIATGINDAGQVVGVSSTNYQGDLAEAWTWQNGTMTDIGTEASRGDGWGTVLPLAINNAGQVVGTNLGGAFLWQNDTMTSLNSLVPTGSGWNLETAISINNIGQIIGDGSHNGANTEYELTLSPSNSAQISLSGISAV